MTPMPEGPGLGLADRLTDRQEFGNLPWVAPLSR
jgi:hypothetical protein